MIKILLTTLAPNIDLKVIETHQPPVSVIHSADVKSINRAKYSPLPRVKCRPGAWWAPWRHRWGRELKQSASQPPVLRPTPPHLTRARWTDAKQELRNCVSVAVTHATARGLSPLVDTTSPGERQGKKAWHPDYLRPAPEKTMSAEELGSEGRWFGDDYDRNGLFGNAPTQFAELREDFKPRGGEVASDLDQQFHPHQDDGRRPPVTMETASTGKPGHLWH